MNGFYQSDRKLLSAMKADDRLTTTDFRVMLAAMENTKLPGDAVALGIDFLAKGTRISSRAIVRSRKRLVELGYLVPCKTGQRGLSYFTVATPDAVFTDSGVTDAVFTERSVMGTSDAAFIGTPDASVIQRETGNIETTSFAPNDEKPPSSSVPEATKPNVPKPPSDEPTDSAKLKSNPLAQGTATPPKSPSLSSGGKGKAPTPKVAWDGACLIVPDALMKSWSESYPYVDLRVAIKRAASWLLANPAKRKKNYARFLDNWLGKVRPGSPEYIDPQEQAALDAQWTRDAEQVFPDPEERADYWWRCKQRGEHVPPGVECRPMPERMVVAQ